MIENTSLLMVSPDINIWKKQQSILKRMVHKQVYTEDILDKTKRTVYTVNRFFTTQYHGIYRYELSVTTEDGRRITIHASDVRGWC